MLFLTVFCASFKMISCVIDGFISKVNDDFQEAIEKLAVQSKAKISSATLQFEATVLDSQGNKGAVLICRFL